MKRIIPLDEIVPCGTKVSIGGSEWAFGDFIKQGGTGIVYAVDETRPPFRRGVIKILRPDRQDAAESFDREIVRLRERIAGERNFHAQKFQYPGSEQDSSCESKTMHLQLFNKIYHLNCT